VSQASLLCVWNTSQMYLILQIADFPPEEGPPAGYSCFTIQLDRVAETRRLTADCALAQDGAHEPHPMVAVDKHPAEVVILQSAVMSESRALSLSRYRLHVWFLAVSSNPYHSMSGTSGRR
jgi:hypothetical protein